MSSSVGGSRPSGASSLSTGIARGPANRSSVPRSAAASATTGRARSVRTSSGASPSAPSRPRQPRSIGGSNIRDAEAPAPSGAHRSGSDASQRLSPQRIGGAADEASLASGDSDAKIVELMTLAASHGCGDMEPEAAVSLLGDVGWDVSVALAQVCGSTHSRGGSRAATLAAFSDAEHMRLQQAEWDRAFAAVDETGSLREARHATQRAAVLLAGERDGALADAELAALVNALANLDSDGFLLDEEAGLRDAMLRSMQGEHRNAPSFDVAPADETVVALSTAIATYSGAVDGDDDPQCSICFADFDRGESLRTLPCLHRFHTDCVDQWLARSGQCPVCKHVVGSAHNDP